MTGGSRLTDSTSSRNPRRTRQRATLIRRREKKRERQRRRRHEPAVAGCFADVGFRETGEYCCTDCGTIRKSRPDRAASGDRRRRILWAQGYGVSIGMPRDLSGATDRCPRSSSCDGSRAGNAIGTRPPCSGKRTSEDQTHQQVNLQAVRGSRRPFRGGTAGGDDRRQAAQQRRSEIVASRPSRPVRIIDRCTRALSCAPSVRRLGCPDITVSGRQVVYVRRPPLYARQKDLQNGAFSSALGRTRTCDLLIRSLRRWVCSRCS